MSEARTPWTFEATLKSRDVEELVNLHWHRPLAFLVVRALRPWPAISPNHITLMSGTMGVLAGVCGWLAAPAEAGWAALGGVLLLVSVVLDCADGMLARLRGISSPFGMLLDGSMDMVVGAAVCIGMGQLSLVTIDQWWTTPMLVLVFASVVVHCALYDHYKNQFLSYVDPAAGTVTEREHRLVPEDAGRLQRVLGSLYRRVYGRISSFSAGAKGTPVRARVSPERARSLLAPAMRKMSWLGLGTQMALIYVAMFLAELDPWLPLPALGLLIGGLMNLWVLFALRDWRRRERQLLAG